MTQEKTRIFALARELNIPTRELLEWCQQAGLEIKNQLQAVDSELRERIIRLVEERRRGASRPAPLPTGSILPPTNKPIRDLSTRHRPAAKMAKGEAAPAPPAPAPTPAAPAPESTPSMKAARVETAPNAPTGPAPVSPAASVPAAPPATAVPSRISPPAAAPTPSTPPTPSAPAKPAPSSSSEAAAPVAPAPPATPAQPGGQPVPAAPGGVRQQVIIQPEAPATFPPASTGLSAGSASVSAPPGPAAPTASGPAAPARTIPPSSSTQARSGAPTRPVAPSRPQPVPGQAPRSGGAARSTRSDTSAARSRPLPSIKPTGTSKVPPVAPPPAPKISTKPTPAQQEEPVAKPIVALRPEDLRKGLITPELLKRREQEERGAPRKPKEHVPPVAEEEEESEERRRRGKGRPGGVGDREERRKERERRAQERRAQANIAVVQGRVITEEDEEESQRAVSVLPRRRTATARLPVQVPRKGGKITLEPPITLRTLSEALGIRLQNLLFQLRDRGIANPTINTTLPEELAEELALEAGFELEIKRPPDPEELLLAEANKPDRPEDLVPRAPIVTIMGHVDHGKTSLLDRIRHSNVAATEVGGITQVLRAWRVEHQGKPITFLDTPGHEAFTKMRARGAHVTDIAVIVVAADDGVMPQTEEAINHARAANVSLIVAINKVDLPSANIQRTRQQLYSLGVLPDNMGGDTPFVETSAVTGKGIDELLEAITLVAELKELKANPNKPARGTCLEATVSEGEGVRATLLVQDGTLRRGDVLLCGAAAGRVRQMYDDLGRPITEAGPSTPVCVLGLDEVPEADDSFLVVPDLTLAREIADRRKARRQETPAVRRPAFTLENLRQAEVAELKLIIKADFRGSVEAIRKELEKLQHEEVRLRVLHAGVGAITESDVQLALTSPQDTLIIGFNVVPDDRAQALAEERGIQIRQYNIIYDLTNDIRAALQGKLKPREEVVHLGRAVVRQVFKISRVGTVAGCYVTQGVIRRQGKVRVIREGVVIYPPPDRTASLESLKRFKDDVAEVREGFECGLKIAGYDDVKVGDVIECYRVEEVQRSLTPTS